MEKNVTLYVEQSKSTNKRFPMRYIRNGYSLLELLIVLSIAGILAGVALPSYLEQIKLSRRSAAISQLLQWQLQQASYHLVNNRYRESMSVVGKAAEFYRFEISMVSDKEYTLIATAIDSQSRDTDCRVLTINHFSEKTPVHCWP